jgi:hypoxanthine phosphoribosyltransferase
MTAEKALYFKTYSPEAYEQNPDTLIANAETQLLGLDIEFDSMVGIGMSGMLVLPLLARHFDVPFLALRKPGESSHMRYAIAHGTIGKKWILIDDFVETGATVALARSLVTKATEGRFVTTYQGTYCYGKLFNVSNGEFYLPNGKPKSVVRCEIGDEVYYVPSGEFDHLKKHYLHMVEKTKDKEFSKGESVEYATDRFPNLDSDVIAIILTQIIVDAHS